MGCEALSTIDAMSGLRQGYTGGSKDWPTFGDLPCHTIIIKPMRKAQEIPAWSMPPGGMPLCTPRKTVRLQRQTEVDTMASRLERVALGARAPQGGAKVTFHPAEMKKEASPRLA